MLLQIKSIGIHITESINPMMLMKKRSVSMQTVALVVRVDNRDDGLCRNIGKQKGVFIPFLPPSSVIILIYNVLSLCLVSSALNTPPQLKQLRSSSIKCQNVPGKFKRG